MIIQPKIWGFICTTAHPLGCERNVRDQIERARQRVATGGGGPRNVLVIGASTGYGLAARITAAFGYGAATLGVFLEKPASATRTASAGWYNSAAVHQYAGHAGLACVSINADAFAAATRACAIDAIQRQLGGQVDLVIYSLAAPLRRLPDGSTARTALKPIDATFIAKTIDTDRDAVTELTVPPASDTEIRDTLAVMGGENWASWLSTLADSGVLAENATTVAYSYIGPEITWPIYWHGTIGRAKQHLEATARELRAQHAARGLRAHVAIMKSAVTQACSAISCIARTGRRRPRTRTTAGGWMTGSYVRTCSRPAWNSGRSSPRKTCVSLRITRITSANSYSCSVLPAATWTTKKTWSYAGTSLACAVIDPRPTRAAGAANWPRWSAAGSKCGPAAGLPGQRPDVARAGCRHRPRRDCGRSFSRSAATFRPSPARPPRSHGGPAPGCARPGSRSPSSRWAKRDS